MRRFRTGLYSLAALYFGSTAMIGVGGLGICGSGVTANGVAMGIVIAAIVSFVGVIAVPRAPALGAVLFSIPMSLLLFGALAGDWKTSGAALLCMMAGGFTVFIAKKGQGPPLGDQY